MAAESAAGGDGQVDWMAGNDGSEREMVRTAADGRQGHLEHLVVIRRRLFIIRHRTFNSSQKTLMLLRLESEDSDLKA